MFKIQKNTLRVLVVVAISLLMMGANSCKRDRSSAIIEVDPGFAEYISAYTSGMVSAQAAVTIKLSQPVECFTSQGKEVDTKLFDFSPSIKGKAYWVNNQEVIFRPNAPLKSGEIYRATFNLAKLVDVKEARYKKFDFTFRIIPQAVNAEFEGLVVENRQNPNTYSLEGVLQVADVASDEDLARCVVAKHNGRDLSVDIAPASAPNTYRISIKGVERESKAGQVDVAWDSKPLGGSNKGAISFKVPPIGVFVVVGSQVVQAPNQSVALIFSDLLNSRQDFAGLVEIDGCSNLRFEVDRNILRVYPQYRLESERSIKIGRGVTNALGDRLSEEFQTSFIFEDMKPSVRSVTKGAILPTTEGLIFPFEAVNLKSVLVEIIKIYENNVPYYLQVNQLGGSDELNRVGYPVLKKVVDLSQVGLVVPNRWERYVLDLKSLFVADAGALYQIKISFNKHQLLDPCEGVEVQPVDETINSSQFDEPGYYSYYSYDYDDDYDWNQRDNPCNSAYYTSDRRIQQSIMSSDIGIIAKMGSAGGMLVAVNDIPTAKPKSGVEVRVSDFQNQTIATGTTNSDGLLNLQLSRRPFLITASNGKQRGYLRVDNATSNSLSNFDVSGAEVQKGLKGMIYGERGVWRPGDTLHICFMLEDKENTIPMGHPVVFELTDPHGALVKKLVQHHGEIGIYHFQVATDPQAPTGNWRAAVKLGGALFAKTVRVETIKPNRLKINFSLSNNVIPVSGNIDADLSVKWLHGAVAQNMKGVYEITVSRGRATFPNHDNFIFDDPSIYFATQTATLWEGSTNAYGVAKVQGSISRAEQMPAAVNVLFKGRVFEPGGDFSIDLFSSTYNPFSEFVGVVPPQPEAGKSWVETDKNHDITIATVDAKGNPTSCRNVVVELYKTTWRWWWEQPSGGEASYMSSNIDKLVMRTTTSTVNGRGTATLRVDYPEWGRYFLKVINRNSGSTCGTYVYFDWPYGMAKSQGDRPGGANVLSLATDKLEYNVNEDIKLTFPGVPGGRALISIENGSRVISSYWVSAEKQSNPVSIKVLPGMAPNVYVHVTMLQPHNQKNNDLPIRMFGIAPLKINDPQTILKPVISMPDELKSESTASILVRESSGKKMSFTLALVDEGLLDITRFRTPDPHSVFYAREAIGVKTWDLYNDVIGAYGGRMERLLSIGGDEEIKANDMEQVTRFVPLVRFFGPYTVEGKHDKKINVSIPNYAGSVRVMVVAGNKGAYGFAEKSCPVRNEIMVMATLPRVLGPMETIALPVNVFVSNPKITKVNVKVRTSDNVEILGDASQTVDFSGATEKMVYFKLKTGVACTPVKVEVIAEGNGAKSNQEVSIEVRNPISRYTKCFDVVVPAESTEKLNFATFGIKGSNLAMLEASALPPLNLNKRLDELIQYPHGCVEQTTSAAFPLIYLKSLVELTPAQADDANKFVGEAISKISRMQSPSGGFYYWPSSTTIDEWSTTYAGHFLLEARSRGYDVPQHVIDSWLTYQKQAARQYSYADNSTFRHDLLQSYRLYSLALAKKPEVGAMNKLRENEIGLIARMRLAAAYVLIGQDAAALKLVEAESYELQPYRELSYTYGSHNRDRAIILETLLLLKQESRAFPVAMEVSSAISGNQWLSTQETAVMLAALSKMAIGDGKSSDLKMQYKLNGKSGSVESKMPIVRGQLDIAEGDNKIELTNGTKNRIFASISVSGIPQLGEEASYSNNLKMSVKYMLKNGAVVDPAKLKQGTDFICEVTVSNPGIGGELNELALTQIFPSGWEIQNQRLDGTGGEQAFTYQDIRDDRVLTYFGLHPSTSKTFTLKLTATYAGRFYMPGPHCAAMYDSSISAAQSGGWVVVEQ